MAGHRARSVRPRASGGSGPRAPAGRLDALEQRLLRQTEMEADDLRLQLLDHFAEGGIERRAVRSIDRRSRIETMLAVVARKPLLPARFSLRREIDRRVAKEVHVH